MWLVIWGNLWSHIYLSYPLSRLRNGAYPSLAVLFSSRIPPLKFLFFTSRLDFKPHPASRQTYVGPFGSVSHYTMPIHTINSEQDLDLTLKGLF